MAEVVRPKPTPASAPQAKINTQLYTSQLIEVAMAIDPEELLDFGAKYNHPDPKMAMYAVFEHSALLSRIRGLIANRVPNGCTQ